MSCYEWTAGKIILPAAGYAKVKTAIKEAHEKRLLEAFGYTQDFWQNRTAKEKSDRREYAAAVQRYVWGNYAQSSLASTAKVPEELRDVVAELLGLRFDADPKRVLKGDLKLPTNRTTDFHEGELSLYFDQKAHSVRYEVGEGNHARDWAEKTQLHRVFMEQMDKVRWSRSSGGVLLGNDEYNREGGHEYEGGGGSYVVAAFGFIGVREAPQNVRTPFLDAKGQQLQVSVKVTRTGMKGTVEPYRAHRYNPYARAW